MHIGKPGHRLDREMVERHAVADFAEHLPDIAVEARFRLVGEAEEADAAARIDIVERVGGAGAHVEGAELARCVEAELHAVDAGAALPCIGMQVGADITGGKAGTPGSPKRASTPERKPPKRLVSEAALPSPSAWPQPPNPCVQKVKSREGA